MCTVSEICKSETYLGEDGHGEQVQVGLTPPAHVHVDVLARVVPTKDGQGLVGSDNELIPVTVAHGGWAKPQVYEVQAELADGALAVVADGEVALGRLVWQHVRVERGEELKLDIRGG